MANAFAKRLGNGPAHGRDNRLSLVRFTERDRLTNQTIAMVREQVALLRAIRVAVVAGHDSNHNVTAYRDRVVQHDQRWQALRQRLEDIASIEIMPDPLQQYVLSMPLIQRARHVLAPRARGPALAGNLQGLIDALVSRSQELVEHDALMLVALIRRLITRGTAST
ncbi:Uncharacterized protein PBTT_08762 [Plasmodiophora brassicae]|nr:hypothetical protein PBRA_005401 [Plasmodiophora brassicae]